MRGIYGWSLNKNEWYWKIVVHGAEVESGYCKHKKALQKVIDKNPMVSWYQDIELE